MNRLTWTRKDEDTYLAARNIPLLCPSTIKRDAFVSACIDASEAFEKAAPPAPNTPSLFVIRELSELNELWCSCEKKFTNRVRKLTYIIEQNGGELAAITLHSTLLYDISLPDDAAMHPWLPPTNQIILSEPAFHTMHLSYKRVPSQDRSPLGPKLVKMEGDARIGLSVKLEQTPGVNIIMLRGAPNAVEEGGKVPIIIHATHTKSTT